MAANQKLDIDHYTDMAAKNHRGLVPMVFMQASLPYAAGAVAGFMPDQAKALHDAGTAVPHKSVFEAGSVEGKADASIVTNGTAEDARKSAIDLGTDPLGLHQLEKIKLAKAVSNLDVTDAAAADAILRAEIDRRALLTPTPAQVAHNAVQTQVNPAAVGQAAGAAVVTSQTGPFGKGGKA